MTQRSTLSRRAILRGAGVALALPLFESLAPRPSARAQASVPKRLVVAYFPNGAAAQYWPPVGKGQGSAWSLSPVLAPLAPLKDKLVVVSNLENYSAMREDPYVEPSHARLCGAFLTCADSDRITQELKAEIANGVSMDQLLAKAQPTALRSLQLGLSTLNSYEDGRHPALSRSISWASPTEPLYKEVNPQAVFDRLVASGARSGTVDAAAQAEAERRRALKLSALDFVLESARSLNARLGREDKPKLDQFLTSTRELEQRVRALGGQLEVAPECTVIARPPRAYAVNTVDGYDRGTHSAIMNDLIVMALQCDVTRVVSHMLDDARSDFVYDHLTVRRFSAAGSTEGTGKVGGFHGLQHAGDSNDGYATINWWFSAQVAALGQRLDAIAEGDGTMLDNTLIVYGGAMHGSDHDARPLPMALLGGGGLGLRTDQHVDLSGEAAGRPLRDLYFTLLTRMYGQDIKSFGESLSGAPHRILEELLA